LPRWVTAAELAGPRLGEALTACGASLDTSRPDIQGQRLVEVVTWLLAEPIARARIDKRPLPDLHPDHVAFSIGDELTLRRLTETTFDGPADAHIRAHLAPLIRAVNAATKRPETALWRAVKDRTDGAIAWIAETTGRRRRAFDLLQDTAELRLIDLGTHDTLLHVRTGCCLYYRTPANVKCIGCPLLDDEERRRLSGAA
jgi:hypothetical protein